MSTFLRRLDSLGALAKSRGVWQTARYVLGRIVIRRIDTLVYEIDLDDFVAPTLGDDLSFQVVDKSRMSGISADWLRLLGWNAQDYLAELESGGLLFGVCLPDGEPLNYGFVMFTTRQKKVLAESFEVPLIGNCFTVAERRGRGLFPKALGLILGVLKEQGHRRAIIEVSPENLASRHGIEKAGFRYLHRITGVAALRKLLITKARSTGETEGWVLRVF